MCATTWPTSSAPPSEGVRGQRAVDWRLVDAIAKPQQFAADGAASAPQELAAQSDRPADGKGVTLTPLARTLDADALALRARHGRDRPRQRTATFTVKAPTGAQPADIAGIEAAGAAWWPLADGARTRRRDPAHAHQRAGHRHLAAQDRRATPPPCWPSDATLLAQQGPLAGARDHRPAAPHAAARLDVSSRSLFALIEPGSCFAGTLLELALAADRSYMLALPDDAAQGAQDHRGRD